MSQQPQPSSQQPPLPPQKKSGSGMSMLFLGCGGVLLLCMCVCAGGVYYVINNVENIAAEGARMIAVAVINDSDLTDEQKQGMIGHIDGLTQDYKDGKITMDDLERVATEVTDGPLIYVGTVIFVETQYIAPSGLSTEEKEEARLNLQRFARGIYEKSIPQTAVDSAITPLQETKPDGSTELKQPGKATDEELRAFLANVEQEADAAEIPNEPFDVDIVKEFGDAIDRALGRRGMELSE